VDPAARGRPDETQLDDADIDHVVNDAIDLAAERVVRAVKDFRSVPIRSQESAVVAARVLRRADDLNVLVMEGVERSRIAQSYEGGQRRLQEREPG
jgi:exosome complex RNA-binding protein Csl4